MHNGELREALELLTRARTITQSEPFSELDHAEILYRLGVCRYRLSSISTAIGLFNEAYAIAEGSALPCDLLRSSILAYRSRCYRRQRDLEAAREDVERALELAQSLDDSPMMANVYVQASLVAERMGHWVLARNYAERAKSLYEELNDQRYLAGLLNNLGGLNLMLGKPEEAIEYLKSSYSTALDADSTEEAAQATGSLAAVHLELNDFEQAERFARQALSLLEGRVDFLARDRPVTARPRPGTHGARASGRSRRGLQGRRRQLRTTVLRQPPRPRMDRHGRPRHPQRRRPDGCPSLPQCR